MKNLRVFFNKVAMHLFFLLLIFNSCTNGESLALRSDNSVNNGPLAVTKADVLSGDAPLQINFSGNNLSDDSGIVSYHWEFPDMTSSDQNATYTFINPGVYDIKLTVTDDESLTATATLTITVTEGNQTDTVVDTTDILEDCFTNGGKANESGLKTWCWSDITLPTYADSKGVPFSDNQLNIDSECYENALSIIDDQLHFFVDPINPPTDTTWCNQDFNMRAELRTNPWRVQHPLGTEEWFGWSYTFGDDYIIDTTSPFLFFQMQNGEVGYSPPVELTVVPSTLYGASNGEVAVLNFANLTETDRTLTGVIPTANTKLDIVLHVIHDLGNDGLLQVWINDNLVYNKQVGTVYAETPWGGNAKFGIYKWDWRGESAVLASAAQGVTSVKTSMGALRIITRRPGDEDYRTDSYSLVNPD